MPLTRERDTVSRPGVSAKYGVAANAVIFKGAFVCLNAAGFAVPGSTSTTLKAVGRAEETVNNTGGANGAVSVEVESGVFRWANSGVNPCNITHITGNAYIVDDETVAGTDGTGTRSVAGVIVDLDAQGVWVRTGLKS